MPACVLVVEDERKIADLLRTYLEHDGLDVITTGSGAALASVPGRVFSRYELVNRVRRYEYQGYERTIDSHIRNLRRKIETSPHAPRLIDTVTGAGYRLAVTRDHNPHQAAADQARAPRRRDA